MLRFVCKASLWLNRKSNWKTILRIAVQCSTFYKIVILSFFRSSNGAQLLKRRNHERFLNRFPLQVITMKRMGERGKRTQKTSATKSYHQLNLPKFQPAPLLHFFINSRVQGKLTECSETFNFCLKSSNIFTKIGRFVFGRLEFCICTMIFTFNF